MEDDRSLFASLIADGRPLLTLTALSLLFSGGFALFLTSTTQFLPHDLHFLQMSSAELCALANCRINAFMFHDRAAFGGALIAVGTLYLWLIEFPLRARQTWAWWTLAVTGSIGFVSFLAYLGYGYLDSWHGTATLALIPIFLFGLLRTRQLVSKSEPSSHHTIRSRILALDAGRALLLATALGMVMAGGTIMLIGMTRVFVPDDLAFMGVTAEYMRQLNPRLVPLIAHDRAGFGGGLFTTGLIVGLCVWFSPLTRALRQALWLAGAAGFGCAIGVHLVVGYTAWRHLGPAIAGAAIFVAGMTLSARATSGDLPPPKPAKLAQS